MTRWVLRQLPSTYDEMFQSALRDSSAWSVLRACQPGYRRAPEEPCLRHGEGGDTSPQKGLLHSNFGCCIGTIQKSATYKICGAAERRAVPIRELVENKREQQLKKKNLSSGKTPHAIHEVQAAARGSFELTSELIRRMTARWSLSAKAVIC
jgi:hypothetical protein